LFFIYLHWAGVSFYSTFYKFAKTYVFIKQSLFSILCWLLFCIKKQKSLFIHKDTESFCRVPSTYLILYLSLLNLSTCVGFSTVFLLLSCFLKTLFLFLFDHFYKNKFCVLSLNINKVMETFTHKNKLSFSFLETE